MVATPKTRYKYQWRKKLGISGQLQQGRITLHCQMLPHLIVHITLYMKVFVLLAAVLQVSQACMMVHGAPQYLLHPYAVPSAVGGYKAVAGSNGDLAGPVHEVPGLVPALATHTQESSGDVSLSTGTGALVPTYGGYYPYSAYHGVYYG